MKPSDHRIKVTGIVLCELFTLTTIIMLLASRQYDRLLLAFATLFLALLPAAMEHVFRCRLCMPVYIFGLLYSIGPMLGQC